MAPYIGKNSEDITPRTVHPQFVHPGLVNQACLLLALEESFRDEAYHCSEGYPTIGYGQRIGPQHHPLESYQFTLPREVACRWLAFNVSGLITQASYHSVIAPAMAQCNLARQSILVSMAYQLGVSGLSQFKKMLVAIENQDWQEAKRQGLDSLWAKQTAKRAERHTQVLLTGYSYV